MENSCKEDFEPNVVKHEENSLSTTIGRPGEFVTPVCTVCTIMIEDSHKSQVYEVGRRPQSNVYFESNKVQGDT